jgi:predicted alpha/beta-fold hydrolase
MSGPANAGGHPYRAPRWLPGAHLQTIVPALFGRRIDVPLRRERWDAPDGDFVDLDWLAAPAVPAAPLLVLFHGLEGNSASRYARAALASAVAYGWHAVVPHFRSCSGEMNRAPRFYHSGDSAEIDWILRRLRLGHPHRIFAAGVSLGGNALLRWLGERREDAARVADAAAAISAPVDLPAGGAALSTGFNLLYTRHFLATLKRKSLAKLVQYPGLFDREAMLASRNLHDFDDLVTAPLHGYRSADDYWRRAASRPLLREITVPTLVLNARNDPFLPATALPGPDEAGPAVILDQPEHGGHVGFPGAGDDWLATRLFAFFGAFA